MARTILVLAANPKNTPQLRLDKEVREIENGLERAQKREEFVLKQKLAVRSKEIRRAMLDLKPSIVHFCGHGSGEDGLVFEDESGQTKLVSADALAGFFELFADKVECVLLNACYSEIQASAIARHIRYVIGMKGGIKDNAAIEFAVAFYDAMGAGNSIEFAFKLACNAIQWDAVAEGQIPVLTTKETKLDTEALTGFVKDMSSMDDSWIDSIAQELNPYVHLPSRTFLALARPILLKHGEGYIRAAEQFKDKHKQDEDKKNDDFSAMLGLAGVLLIGPSERLGQLCNNAVTIIDTCGNDSSDQEMAKLTIVKMFRIKTIDW